MHCTIIWLCLLLVHLLQISSQQLSFLNDLMMTLTVHIFQTGSSVSLLKTANKPRSGRTCMCLLSLLRSNNSAHFLVTSFPASYGGRRKPNYLNEPRVPVIERGPVRHSYSYYILIVYIAQQIPLLNTYIMLLFTKYLLVRLDESRETEAPLRGEIRDLHECTHAIMGCRRPIALSWRHGLRAIWA